MTVTITGDTIDAVYDGTNHTARYTVQIDNQPGKPEYKESYIAFSGDARSVSQKDVGRSDLVLVDNFDNKDNRYANNFAPTFIVTDGYVNVTPRHVDVTITGNTDSVVYNAQERSVEGYDVEINVQAGDGEDAGALARLYRESFITFSGDASITETNAATYTMELTAEQFGTAADKAGNFDVTFTVASDGQLEIAPLPVTLVPDETALEKYYSQEDPELTFTLMADANGDGTPEDCTQLLANDVPVALMRADGEDVGEYAVTIKDDTVVSDNVVLTFEGATFTINQLPVTVTPDADQNKPFGGPDPDFAFTVDSEIDGFGATAEINPDMMEGALARDEGEQIGTYAITQGDLNNDNLDITFDDSVTFEITSDLYDQVKVEVTTQDIDTRTKSINVTVSGFEADISGCGVQLKLNNGGSNNVAAITGNGSFTIAAECLDGTLGSGTYYYWLTEGESTFTMTAGESELNAPQLPTIDVAKAARTFSFTPSTRTALDGSGVYYYSAADPDGAKDAIAAFVMETVAEGEQEVVVLTVTVGGAAVDGSPFTFTVNGSGIVPGSLDAVVNAIYAKDNGSTAGQDVSFAVQFPEDLVVDTSAATLTAKLDTVADSATAESGDFDNRGSGSITVTLVEDGTVTDAESSGVTFNAADGSGKSWTITGGNVSLSSLPSAGQGITVHYTDLAGNPNQVVVTELGGNRSFGTRVHSTGVNTIRITPDSIDPFVSDEETDQPDDGMVKQTPSFKVSGIGIAGETVIMTIMTGDGTEIFRQTRVVGAGAGDSDTWSQSTTGGWFFMVGDDSEGAPALDWPYGEPVTLDVKYMGITGGHDGVILVYDDVIQPITFLTPLTENARVIAGYGEPLSVVTVSFPDDEYTAYTDRFGYFVIEMDCDLYPDVTEGQSSEDNAVLITMRDFAGNDSFNFNDGAERYILGETEDSGIHLDWETERVYPAYPVGTLIQNEIGMARYPATWISMEELAANGTVTLPILQANYFVVGELTATLADGHVTFSHTIADANAAEGEVFFLAGAQAPAADALEQSGMDPQQGYTPAAGEAGFWLVYQVPVTVTDDMLRLADGVETVSINEDPVVQAGFEVLHAE